MSQDFSSDFHLSESGSRLLSESLLYPSDSSKTGHGGEDLSLSELSLNDNLPNPQPTSRRKFSLFAQPPSPLHGKGNDDSALLEEEIEGDDEEGNLDQTMKPEDIEKARRTNEKTREEKLQSDLYFLKKLNAAFNVYKEALRETKSSTERVADQLVHTNKLLDKYVDLLSKSEGVTRMILDERWEGAEADEAQMALEMREAQERKWREEEERAQAAERERERIQRQEQERKTKEDRERLERERQEAAKSVSRGSGVRGVRGTRASMRGTRGVSSSRAASTMQSRSVTPGSGATGSGGIPTRRTGITRGTAAARASTLSRRS